MLHIVQITHLRIFWVLSWPCFVGMAIIWPLGNLLVCSTVCPWRNNQSCMNCIKRCPLPDSNIQGKIFHWESIAETFELLNALSLCWSWSHLGFSISKHNKLCYTDKIEEAVRKKEAPNILINSASSEKWTSIAKYTPSIMPFMYITNLWLLIPGLSSYVYPLNSHSSTWDVSPQSYVLQLPQKLFGTL